MKKILIATTALVMTSGAALAESHGSAISLSGSARMGVVYDGTDAAFSSRVRFSGNGSGTTDGGLTFGASMRFDQTGGNGSDAGATPSENGVNNGDSTVFLSGGFGTITMGDVAGGAADNLVGQVDGVGYTGVGDNNEIGFLGGKPTAVRYNFSTGPISFALGLGQPTAKDEALSAAVKYAPEGGRFTVALGYSSVKGDSQIDAKATATLGAAKVSLRVADRDSKPETAIALSVSGTFGAVGVTAFGTQSVDFANKDTFGIGASYDLGGGASVKGGVVDDGTNTIADLGVTFSF